MVEFHRPKSAADLINMMERQEAEGPTLEFKSSRLLNQKNEKVFESLSIEITAFANSLGGTLIIGVEEEKNTRCIKEIAPISDTKKTEDWLENGLLTRIYPPISIHIERFDFGDGFILSIEVPQSFQGPHQASDRRYYARRLFRVDPLLPFEIDDIRRRTSDATVDVELLMVPRNGGINFMVENLGSQTVFNISIDVEGIKKEDIANSWTPGLKRPYTEPFSMLLAGEKRGFPGAGFRFFAKN